MSPSEELNVPLPAEARDRDKPYRRSWLKIAVYWILVVLGMLVMAAVWAGQISISGIGTSMSEAHAEDDSEGGSFFWFLLSKAFQFAFLGWHSVPFALCAAGQVLRRDEALMRRRLHATLFWIPVLSFAVALVLMFVG